MKEAFERTAMLLGQEGVARLQRAHVLVVGLGGVGGHCVEALARAGIGQLTLMDGDVVAPSNLNRQLVATTEAIGVPKPQALAARLHAILPDMQVTQVPAFFTPETTNDLFQSLDYVVDAVDDMTAKVELAVRCHALGIAEIAAMGAGNKLDPTQLRVMDIFKTTYDPLARRMRQELRKRDIPALDVAVSIETPRLVPQVEGPRVIGSVSFVPSAMGLVLAGHVVRRLCGIVL